MSNQHYFRKAHPLHSFTHTTPHLDSIFDIFGTRKSHRLNVRSLLLIFVVLTRSSNFRTVNAWNWVHSRNLVAYLLPFNRQQQFSNIQRDDTRGVESTVRILSLIYCILTGSNNRRTRDSNIRYAREVRFRDFREESRTTHLWLEESLRQPHFKRCRAVITPKRT